MLTPSDYLGLYSSALLTDNPQKLKELDYICSVILNNHGSYQAVQEKTLVPWTVVAAIHFRESNQNFKCHLHNGDPLTGRTVHFPRNRPSQPEPPYTWQQSACDVLSGLWKPTSWSIAGCLEFMERYNGLGYQKRNLNSPYLWDYTNFYTTGLFVEDGSFDPLAKESRPGCAAIFKSLQIRGITLDFSTLVSSGAQVH